jgi:hypothetical protein
VTTTAILDLERAGYTREQVEALFAFLKQFPGGHP